MTASVQAQPVDNAIVVFGDQTGFFWLRFLKAGFRHCFVLLELEEGWVLLDPLAHWMHVAMIPPATNTEISAWYRERGYRVVSTRHNQPPRIAIPLSPFTCVETVKRALGIQRSGIWTPHQLWKYLNKKK